MASRTKARKFCATRDETDVEAIYFYRQGPADARRYWLHIRHRDAIAPTWPPKAEPKGGDDNWLRFESETAGYEPRLGYRNNTAAKLNLASYGALLHIAGPRLQNGLSDLTEVESDPDPYAQRDAIRQHLQIAVEPNCYSSIVYARSLASDEIVQSRGAGTSGRRNQYRLKTGIAVYAWPERLREDFASSRRTKSPSDAETEPDPPLQEPDGSAPSKGLTPTFHLGQANVHIQSAFVRILNAKNLAIGTGAVGVAAIAWFIQAPSTSTQGSTGSTGTTSSSTPIPPICKPETPESHGPGAPILMGLALDNASLYYGTGTGEVYRLPKSGGSAKRIFPGGPTVTMVRADSGVIYWLDSDGMLRSESGGSVQEIAFDVKAFDVYNGQIEWIGEDGRRVLKQPGKAESVQATGCLSDHAGSVHLNLNGYGTIWTDGRQVAADLTRGGSRAPWHVVETTGCRNPSEIAVVGHFAYVVCWGPSGALFGFDLLRADSAQAVVDAEFTMGYLTSDGTRLYWTTGAGEVRSYDPLTKSLTIVARGEGELAPYAIVADATKVYWINNGSHSIRACPTGS